MIKSSDILEAVRDVLESRFNYLVYPDEVVNNYEPPCFFIKLVSLSKQYREDIKQVNATLYITFAAGALSQYEILDIKDTITSIFVKGLRVKDRFIHFSYITTETVGDDNDMIEFDIPFSYFDSFDDDKENIPMMNNFYYNKEE